MMSVAGIDGCKKGWLMVRYSDNNYKYGVYKHIEESIKDNKDIDRILIDMPLGLSSKKVKRTVEKELRGELKNKSSSVFNPPCREALHEIDYKSAKQKNIEIEGKSLSIQSFNISSKIKELDEFLKTKPNVELIESHPELCFKHLNNGNVLLSKKSDNNGLNERKNILFSYDENLKDLYEQIEQNTFRKDVTRDDIADAICLCLVNKFGSRDKLSFIKDVNKLDEKRIEIRIAYYKNDN
jgi:8-oxo-dGTP diphosphatase